VVLISVRCCPSLSMFQVRERWTCQLNPARLDKEVAPWTAAEETILFGAQQRLGNR
jgi:hypothetical protein